MNKKKNSKYNEEDECNKSPEELIGSMDFINALYAAILIGSYTNKNTNIHTRLDYISEKECRIIINNTIPNNSNTLILTISSKDIKMAS